MIFNKDAFFEMHKFLKMNNPARLTPEEIVQSAIFDAQHEFNTWLDRQIILYGFTTAKGHLMCGTENIKGDTFIARLVNVKELKPQPCMHSPKYIFEHESNECSHCGIKMKLKWEVES